MTVCGLKWVRAARPFKRARVEHAPQRVTHLLRVAYSRYLEPFK
jgi:hypothetical protein